MLDRYKKVRGSIKFKLISAIMITFVVVIFLYNLIINIYTSEMFDEIYKSVGENTTEKVDDIYLFSDSIIFDSNISFNTFNVLIMMAMIIIGCIVLYYIIGKIMKPLERLTQQISEIDINNIESLNAKVDIGNEGYELISVSEAFNTTIGKILKDYEKQKSFNANVAHELRTPLSILRTKIDVFRKKQRTEEEYQELISILYGNIEKMTEMVNKIIMLSKDYSKISYTDVCINDIVEEVVLDLETLAQQKNITLSVSGDKIKLNTNEVLVERIVFNLVENAIKYNDNGGSVDVLLYKNSGSVVIEVKDDGYGINNSDKENIFDIFFRSSKSKGRINGSGVGLALVKIMVDSLRGSISVSDNEPKGSIFKVILK